MPNKEKKKFLLKAPIAKRVNPIVFVICFFIFGKFLEYIKHRNINTNVYTRGIPQEYTKPGQSSHKTTLQKQPKIKTRR